MDAAVRLQNRVLELKRDFVAVCEDYERQRAELAHVSARFDRADEENERLRAGVSWARGMLTDTEPHEKVDAYLGGLLSEETR